MNGVRMLTGGERMTSRSPHQLVEEIAAKEREIATLRQELATHRNTIRVPEGRVTLVRCTLGGAHLAFVQDEVDEILDMAALTVLPDSPPWLMGLLRIGTEVLPVVDLAARDTGKRREADPSELILLARSNRGRFGLVIESLEGVATIDASTVGVPPIDAVYAAYVRGVATLDGVPTLVLAVEPLAPDDVVAPPSRP